MANKEMQNLEWVIRNLNFFFWMVDEEFPQKNFENHFALSMNARVHNGEFEWHPIQSF
jgi:hypothetical protein